MSRITDTIIDFHLDANPEIAAAYEELRQLAAYATNLRTAAVDDIQNTNNTDSEVDVDEMVWKKVYSALFCDAVSGRVKDLAALINQDFSWYDPDSSYESDARAYIDALERYVDEF